MASLKAPLDIPMPDPAKEEAIRKKKEEVEFFFLILIQCVGLNKFK